MIIDGQDLIVGRTATIIAKKALMGENVGLVNCEKMVITGGKKEVIGKFQRKKSMGVPSKGPFQPRRPDMLVKKIIKGMLPHKKPRGRDALKKILCYIGVPDEFKDKKPVEIVGASMSKLPNLKFVSLLDLSRRLGAKIE